MAWANDNTEVIAFAKQNPGYTVGIPRWAVRTPSPRPSAKGNTTLLDWINDEIKSLADEQFFHKDYEETLVDTYGIDYEDELVVEGRRDQHKLNSKQKGSFPIAGGSLFGDLCDNILTA